jgi:hypothetical protein
MNQLPARESRRRFRQDSHAVPYILVLIEAIGCFASLICARALCFESKDYEAARFWLAEDEFEFVGPQRGRTEQLSQNVVKLVRAAAYAQGAFNVS